MITGPCEKHPEAGVMPSPCPLCRVAELEALLVPAMEQRWWVQTDAERFWKERDRYREALEKIRDEDILREDMIDIAIQALNP